MYAKELREQPDFELAISALILAIQMINTYTKKLKYKRKIVLVTNGEGPMSSEGMDEITKKIKADDIELVVLYVFAAINVTISLTFFRGVDFDDPEYGFKEENKDPVKVDGTFYVHQF